MFFHNFKYSLKSLFRNKTTLFWTLIFPIGLATFMYMAFGDLMERDEMFSPVAVAVIHMEDSEEEFKTILDELSKEGEDQILVVTKTDEKKARKLLKEKKVKGVIDAKDISLLVNENGYDSMVLQVVLEEYKQQKNIITEIAKSNPAALGDYIENMGESTNFYVESSTTKASQNQYNNYFYAIFAMSCLFASFVAIERIGRIQANVSALGMRRCLSPNAKFSVICAEYLALLIVQFVIEAFTLLYMKMIGVDFGNRYPEILLVLLVGCSIGLSIGVIIGSFSNLSEGSKQGIAVAISMMMSVMADLCVGGMKDLVEHHVPILNRINPAVLISDCFYALNVYEDYTKFNQNLLIMVGMSVALIVISSFILRRNRYASV